MLTYAIVAAVIAIICYALARSAIALPVSRIVYIVAGLLALLFFAVWLLAQVTTSGPVEIDSMPMFWYPTVGPAR
jgi:sulfite exporter TauE/SafE